jgi:putative glutamine amidotransferase
MLANPRVNALPFAQRALFVPDFPTGNLKDSAPVSKPIIGIMPSPTDDAMPHGAFHRYAIANTYTTAVERAGGVPLVVPPQSGNISEILDVLDGLLLSGGGDIRPARFGDDQVHPTTYGIHDGRDELEIALVQEAIRRDMPVLCICRGIQVLNVALGGTLIQDVAEQFSNQLQHRQSELSIPKEDSSHSVYVEPGSLLAQVYGEATVHVNSFHHQGLKHIAADLRVSGRAGDGLVEAVEQPSCSWVLGVQWHPEMMYAAHVEHLRPFSSLVEAAARKRAPMTV